MKKISYKISFSYVFNGEYLKQALHDDSIYFLGLTTQCRQSKSHVKDFLKIYVLFWLNNFGNENWLVFFRFCKRLIYADIPRKEDLLWLWEMYFYIFFDDMQISARHANHQQIITVWQGSLSWKTGYVKMRWALNEYDYCHHDQYSSFYVYLK